MTQFHNDLAVAPWTQQIRRRIELPQGSYHFAGHSWTSFVCFLLGGFCKVGDQVMNGIRNLPGELNFPISPLNGLGLFSNSSSSKPAQREIINTAKAVPELVYPELSLPNQCLIVDNLVYQPLQPGETALCSK
jgi:hypothetical protein